MKASVLFLVVALVGGLLSLNASPAPGAPLAEKASAGLVWKTEDFNYLADAVAFLNKLPPEQRERGYVIALNSARSSSFTGYYTVIYPSYTQ